MGVRDVFEGAEVLSAALMITFSLFLVLVFGDPLVNTLETLGNEVKIAIF